MLRLYSLIGVALLASSVDAQWLLSSNQTAVSTKIDVHSDEGGPANSATSHVLDVATPLRPDEVHGVLAVSEAIRPSVMKTTRSEPYGQGWTSFGISCRTGKR